MVENGNKIKGLKQNSQQGKQLARTANHDARVAGTAAGRTPSRDIRIQRAEASAKKAATHGDKSAATASTGASNIMSKAINDDETKKEN